MLREDAAAPEGYIIEGRYDYEPFGAKTPVTNTERLGFIGKEKDSESALADHGVRKYESAYGRFTSIDPLWEQYAGWTPYHYCRNNPVMLVDGNGMWIAELSSEKHVHGGYVRRNSSGFLAAKINYQFYNKWKNTAPKIAEHIKNNSIFVFQKSLSETNLGEAELGGNKIWFDLSKNNAFSYIEATAMHEVVHSMGYHEFGAYSAILAAGLYSKEKFIQRLKNDEDFKTDVFNTRDNDNEIMKKIWADYLNGKINEDDMVDSMIEYGETILKDNSKKE